MTQLVERERGERLYGEVGKEGGGSVKGRRDRWVGFGRKKGGYKMEGELEIGLFRSELFVM
ncbi:DUF1054 family protein [Staphylococcus pettenkoferi]|uniref:DUF1054 family protein n=1 Tax=Staphylococcus pettenkoferi TaxID=170573 RepID=UPI00119F8F2C